MLMNKTRIRRKKKNTALVVGSGGFYGAYDAGVLASLCGKMKFDAVYTSSVGALTGTFFAAGQKDAIEHVWRHLVCGRKILNPLNVFKKKPILDLYYLIALFRSGEMKLNTERIFSSGISLVYTLTRYHDGKKVYMAPTHETIFTLMKASAAIPFLYPKVPIGDSEYIDGAFVDPLPFERARADGYEDITVVTNKWENAVPIELGMISKSILQMLNPRLKHFLEKYKGEYLNTARKIPDTSNIRVIRPSVKLPLNHFLDTDQNRISNAFAQGKEDGKRFMDGVQIPVQQETASRAEYIETFGHSHTQILAL